MYPCMLSQLVYLPRSVTSAMRFTTLPLRDTPTLCLEKSTSCSARRRSLEVGELAEGIECLYFNQNPVCLLANASMMLAVDR